MYALNLAKEAIKKEDSVLIMEGYFDVITAHMNGIKNAVATCKRAGIKTVIIPFENKPDLDDVSEVVKDCDFVVFKGALENGGSVRGINAKGQAEMPRKKIDALVELLKDRDKIMKEMI